MTKHYSLKDVAKILGVKPFRISYALSNGYLPEPLERITNRRMFSENDLKLAREYFDKHPSMKGDGK